MKNLKDMDEDIMQRLKELHYNLLGIKKRLSYIEGMAMQRFGKKGYSQEKSIVEETISKVDGCEKLLQMIYKDVMDEEQIEAHIAELEEKIKRDVG